MKKLFILLACAATVVACSKDETIASFQGDAIKFGNPFVNKSTRLATFGDGVDFKKFKVWGTASNGADLDETALIFNGVEFTGEVGADVWTCAPANVQYWINEAYYTFTAFASTGTEGTVNVDATYGMPETITISDIQNNQEDLILAQAVATGHVNGQNATVNLTFHHLLSKAKFTVESEAQNGYTHTVKNIKIKNFSNGTYTLDAYAPVDGTWAGGTSADILFEAIENVSSSTVAGDKDNEEVLLIPNKNQFNVSFEVDFCKDGVVLYTKECHTNAVDTDLVAGYAYNFIIDIEANDQIQFKVSADPVWTDASSDTFPVTLQ